MHFKIIDNFLDQNNFDLIKSIMTSRKFPWYYASCANDGKDNLSQLTHSFYTTEYANPVTGDMSLIKPLLDKLNYKDLIRIKANLTYPSINTKDFFHTDNNLEDTTTAIYYLDNFGGTKIKIGTEIKYVESQENRMLMFPSYTQHSVVRHSNNDKGRFVLNFNYKN